MIDRRPLPPRRALFALAALAACAASLAVVIAVTFFGGFL